MQWHTHTCTHTHNEDVEIFKKELIRSSVVEMYLANFTQEMWMDTKKITDYEVNWDSIDWKREGK